MSKRKKRGPVQAARPAPSRPAQPSAPALIPFKPRPKLFVVLVVLFGAWIAALLALYILRVYPARHSHPVMVHPATVEGRPLAPLLG